MYVIPQWGSRLFLYQPQVDQWREAVLVFAPDTLQAAQVLEL